MKIKCVCMASIALIIGLTSCNTDENVDTKTKTEGEPTFMYVTLNCSAEDMTQLRASVDNNTTEAEIKISSVDVFIYNQTGTYLSHTSLPGSDFTSTGSSGTGDVYQGNTKIQTTIGLKHVFVAVNMPAETASALEYKESTALTQLPTTINRNQLVSAAGIWMTSGIMECDFAADENDPANNPIVTVKRMAAKVTVQKSPTMVQYGAPGQLPNLSFVVDNFNLRCFLVQKTDSKDPNWDSGSYNPSDFSKFSPADFVLVNEATAVLSQDFNILYASENTSEDHKQKEITRALVRGAFIPEKVILFQNNDYVEIESSSLGITAAQTFWLVTLFRPGPEYKFFYTQSIAQSFALANGLTNSDVVTYTDGHCYWDIFLNKNRWDVFRNDYYKCTITRIALPGRANPDVTDPENPPVGDANISIDVEVIPWNTFTYNYDLEP